jgi:hypothetical protein
MAKGIHNQMDYNVCQLKRVGKMQNGLIEKKQPIADVIFFGDGLRAHAFSKDFRFSFFFSRRFVEKEYFRLPIRFMSLWIYCATVVL